MKKSSFVELEGRQKRRPIQYLDVKVTMQTRSKNEGSIEQLLQKVDISKCMNNSYDSIVVSRLLSQLQIDYNIPLQNRAISYWLPSGELFVTCGIHPLGEDVLADLKEIDLDQHLHIKTKNLGFLNIDRLMYTQTGLSNLDHQKDQVSEVDDDSRSVVGKGKGKKQSRRTKQRRIGYIIEKVIEWRKYYSGTSDQSRQTQKYSLEDAAKKVGISKKSLDDYLFQIRFGYRYTFNFNEHYNEKVGILRDYVRQKKKQNNRGDNKRRRRGKVEDKEGEND